MVQNLRGGDFLYLCIVRTARWTFGHWDEDATHILRGTARPLVGRCFSYPPEAESHSFFFIDQRVEPSPEAKLHRHAARELYYIVQRDDLFAVRHATPLEYGPRAAEAFTKMSIGICYTVGFNDLPHFVRVFTKNIGMPPSQYRKSCNRMRTDRIHSAS